MERNLAPALWTWDIRCGLCSASAGAGGGRGHYHYRNPIISMYHLWWHILENAVRRSHLNAVRFIRISASASVHLTWDLTSCLRALVSQPSPEQRTRACNGRYIAHYSTRGHPGEPEIELCVMGDNRFLVGRGGVWVRVTLSCGPGIIRGPLLLSESETERRERLALPRLTLEAECQRGCSKEP